MKRKRSITPFAYALVLLVTAGFSVAPRESSAQPSTTRLRFAQITDAHLFDAGCELHKGEECTSIDPGDFRENVNALRWSIDEIARRWESGDRIDFLVFTGDLGLDNLAGTYEASPPVAAMKCSDADAPGGIPQPKSQMQFVEAEMLLARLLSCLPAGVPAFFVPGNNDVTGENPQDIARYTNFVAGVRSLSVGHPVADLTGTTSAALHDTFSGYTLVGLDSSGFKPQKYTDGNSGKVNESHLVMSGSVPYDATSKYCEELPDTPASGTRATAKSASINKLVSLIEQPGRYLIFTHEPDLRDPVRTTNKTNQCEYRSTWLLPKSARTTWESKVLHNRSVVGVFAGHFHAATMSSYIGPQLNSAVAATAATASSYTAPTYVTTPLAVKYQWGHHPSARGMTFFTVRGETITQEQIVLPTVGACGDGGRPC